MRHFKAIFSSDPKQNEHFMLQQFKSHTVLNRKQSETFDSNLTSDDFVADRKFEYKILH